MEIALTGSPLRADRLHELGLINRLADAGRTLDIALALAEEIGSAGQMAVIESKALLRSHAHQTDGGECWAEQDAAVRRVNSSEQAHEGVQAFLEKRKPRWGIR